MAYVAAPLEQRLWSRVERGDPSACWPWTGHLTGGYGRIRLPGGGGAPTHRVAYELLVGPIPEGLVLDHVCRNTVCCNPAHLEPVTVRENTRRGLNVVAENIKKTHCPRGHAYDATSVGRRHCRTCKRDSTRRWRAERRAA